MCQIPLVDRSEFKNARGMLDKLNGKQDASE